MSLTKEKFNMLLKKKWSLSNEYTTKNGNKIVKIWCRKKI